MFSVKENNVLIFLEPRGSCAPFCVTFIPTIMDYVKTSFFMRHLTHKSRALCPGCCLKYSL